MSTPTKSKLLLRIEVIEALDELEQVLASAQRMLTEENEPAVLVQDKGATRDDAIDALLRLYYEEDQDPGSTYRAPGLIISSRFEIFDLVDAVNAAKERFARVRREYSAAANRGGRGKGRERDSALHNLLTRKRRHRLNLLQCDRKWTLLPENTIKVGFSWCSGGRSVVRTTVSEVRAKLEIAGAKGRDVTMELARLEGLDGDTPLAIAKPRAQHIRANVVTSDRRFPVMASVPLLVARSPKSPVLPEHNWLPETPPVRSRLQRSDRTIAEEPLISWMNVYPYIDTPLPEQARAI